jgi:hypothetical protein
MTSCRSVSTAPNRIRHNANEKENIWQTICSLFESIVEIGSTALSGGWQVLWSSPHPPTRSPLRREREAAAAWVCYVLQFDNLIINLTPRLDRGRCAHERVYDPPVQSPSPHAPFGEASHWRGGGTGGYIDPPLQNTLMESRWGGEASHHSGDFRTCAARGWKTAGCPKRW